MNKRIWQLQGQANVLAEEIVSQRKYDDYMEYKQSLMDQTMNKFAELLLKECIQVVDDTMTENQDMNIGLVMASAAIVSHFGVEE